MTAEQRQELLARIKRSKGKRMPIEVKLLIVQLEAECYRHSDAIITARDTSRLQRSYSNQKLG